MAKTYEEALQEARSALQDIKERGEDAIGPDWEDVRKELFTPEEIAASDIRVALISELIKARQEKGISPKELERLSGIKKSTVTKFEKGYAELKLDTVSKLLAPLGKKLAIVPM